MKPKPLNHKRWTLIYLLTILLSLMFAPYGHSQTLDCNHEPSIEYFDNMRTLPGYVTQLEGTEVTLKTADKHAVVVRTFHLTDHTEFYTEKAMQAHSVDRTYFESHKDGCWVVRYCAHCRVAFKMIRMET